MVKQLLFFFSKKKVKCDHVIEESNKNRSEKELHKIISGMENCACAPVAFRLLIYAELSVRVCRFLGDTDSHNLHLQNTRRNNRKGVTHALSHCFIQVCICL